MPISEMPVLSALRTKMQWHQERQRVLAENVANADSPKFRPRDLVEPQLDGGMAAGDSQSQGGLTMARTNPAHLSISTGEVRFPSKAKNGFEVRPSGNAVSLEEQMMKIASNQMDYQAATTLYSRSLGLIKTAIGKR